MERFIIGTGRCGSTLLSNMVARHPDVLVVSEFFKGFDPWVDAGGKHLSGEEFANFLAAPCFTVDLPVRRGFVPPEVLHGVGASDLQRISVPKLFVSALPTITDKPEQLFADSIAIARTFPVQPMARHYLMYFEWLQQRMNRKCWLERSGGSMEIMPELRRMFPHGKYLHLHRDGPEAALSMREHAYFRLYVSLYFNPPTRAELERTEIAGMPIGDDDPLTWRMTEGLPSYEQFGEFWSHQVAAGFREFADMDRDQWQDLRFEDLVARPRDVLEKVAAFFELTPDPDWLDEAAQMVEAIPRRRVPMLPPGDRAALERGCRIGQHLLRRLEWEGVDATIELMQEIAVAHGTQRNDRPVSYASSS